MLNTSEQFWQGNLCCEHSSRCLGMQMFRYGGKCCTKHSVHKYLCTKTALVSHTVVFFASHPELNNKSKFLEKNLKYFVGLVARKWPTTLAKAAEHFTNASSFWVAVVVVDLFFFYKIGVCLRMYLSYMHYTELFWWREDKEQASRKLMLSK